MMFKNCNIFLAFIAAMILLVPPVMAEGIQDSLDLSTPEGTKVTLIADQITYDSETEVVTATGNVIAHYGERSIRADQIVYDANKDKIGADGAIAVRNVDGTYLFADSAELDGEFKDGLIRGARALMTNGGKVAAVEARRVDGVFTAFSKAVFSMCKVCADNPNPLWQIRAEKIIHDAEKKDIIYEDVTFDILGQPIGFIPFFRHPDPSVKRRSGWLPPELLTSKVLGSAIKTPYYLVIDEHSDATIKPFFSNEEGLVMEGEYRRKFSNGAFNANGSATYAEDDDGKESFRGHIFTRGSFTLDPRFGRPWNTGFNVRLASDDSYLRRYELSTADRLTSRAYLDSFTEDGFISANAYYFQSFRADEPHGTIPLAVPEIEMEKHWSTPYIGGRTTTSLSALHLNRSAGRDVTRFTAGLDWNRGFTFSNGLLFNSFANVRADYYQVTDDAVYDDDSYTRFLPQIGGEVRYPLFKDNGSTTHILEPIAQVIVAPYAGNPTGLPNEDSIDTELDETTLFSKNKFPGFDRWEEGPRLSLGVRYERESDDGILIDASFGQSFRLRELEDFTENSSLNNQNSDYVGAYTIDFKDYFTLTHRFRVDEDDFNFNRNEVYLSSSWNKFTLTGTYVFVEADPELNEPKDRSELNGYARYKINNNWSINGTVRRDLISDRFVNLGGGIVYQNECIAADFSVSRRFNSRTGAPSDLSFGLSVRLIGL